MQLTTSAITTTKDNLNSALTVLRSVAERCSQLRAAAEQAISDWRSKRSTLTPPQLSTLADQVNRELGEAQREFEQALDSAADKLSKIQPGFQQKAAQRPSWQATAIQSELPAYTNPRDIARWWAGLTPQQRDFLLAHDFDQLGRMRGLPANVLNTANRRRIEVDAERFTEQRAQLNGEIGERARELGLDPHHEEKLREANDPELSRLLYERKEAGRRAENAKHAADRLREADSMGHGDGVYLMSWDPDGPGHKKGTMAVAFGNPDTARNLAVCVPGTSASLGPDGFDLDRGANLKQQMDSTSQGNAVIQWMGYDAPDAILSSQVVSPAQANDGAPRLVADVDGYRAAGDQVGNHQHLTVIGHSYGSTVVGKAGMHGLAADDIAFVGSPGVGASRADQLSAGAGHVWAGATRHDPVVQATQGGWFTEDSSGRGPYDSSFGARQFGAVDDPGATSWVGNAHSQYFDPGSESLRNLGDIATGKYGDVSAQRWQDNPLPPEIVRRVPIVDPIIGTKVKDAVQTGTDVYHGAEHTVTDIGRGDFGGAAVDSAKTVKTAVIDTADAVSDTVVDTAGGLVATGHAVVQGADWVWDHSLGKLF